MKVIIITIAVILCFAIRSEILSMMALLAGGIGFIGMIINARIGGN